MLLSFLEADGGGLAYGFFLVAGLFKLFLCFKTLVVVLVFFDSC